MINHSELKFKEELELRKDYSTNYIILHHTEVETPHTVNDIHRWHQKKGYAGIGYHYFIRKDGEIYEGRPIETVGAHTKGYNGESVGIAYEGDFNKQTMSERQEDAGVMLIALLSLAYEDAGVVGRSELADGTSPGKHFPLERIKEKVETCKKWLKALFGEEKQFWIMDAEGRNHYVGLDDEANEKRQQMPSSFTDGNFDYNKILDLLSEVSEGNDL